MVDNDKGLIFLSSELSNTIDKCLSNLRFEIGAQCILLVDISGQLITQVGLTGKLDVTNLVSLLAGGFATTFEMSKYLGEKQGLNLKYHEGPVYEVYSANVGENLFLTIIFDRNVRSSRIGMVWLYTKRSIQELLTALSTSEDLNRKQVIDVDFSSSVSDRLDNIFDI